MKWAKKSNGQWHKLFELELCERCLKDVTGVYIVFYKEKKLPSGSSKYLVLKLGQGHVKTKLLQLRKDPAMSVHRDKDPLVTWIPVPPLHLDNIEQVLNEKLEPIMEM
jgi:hypothetical protein